MAERKDSSQLQPDPTRVFSQPTKTDDIRHNMIYPIDKRDVVQYHGEFFESHERWLITTFINGLLYFIIGTALGHLFLALRQNADGQSAALPHAPLHQSLNPGETLVVPPVQRASPGGIDPSSSLFSVDLLLCTYISFFVISVKLALSNGWLRDGGPMIEGRADPQNGPDRFEKWPFDFLLESHTVILLVGTVALIYGVYQRIQYLTVVLP